MISITVICSGRTLYNFVSEKTIISIGRMESNDICLENIGISKLHARIFELDGMYMLEDCHSTNGTYLNDELVHKNTPLEDGDIIGIMRYYLKISINYEDENPKNPENYEKTMSIGEKKRTR